MLHEILLSLSGHPSPLLSSDRSAELLSPPERALLKSLARLSELHGRIRRETEGVAGGHRSVVCRAVAMGIKGEWLGAFQRRVLEVEEGILRGDAEWVGGQEGGGEGKGIVPLTGLVGGFEGWQRRMEWFEKVVGVMMKGSGKGGWCSGAEMVDWLCGEAQTGYADIEEVALSLGRVAEMAWLKQVSGWVLYGRLPGFGREDFFVQNVDGDVEVRVSENGVERAIVDNLQEYELKRGLLPAFVTPSTAASLLFIGKSLNHIRVKSISGSTSPDLALIQTNLRELSTLKFPINSAHFSRVIASIRLWLSRTTLQKLLPTSKVIEVLSLLQEFFLLGRGAFAIALINEADEKLRSRWQRSDNLASEKRDGLGNVVVKEGEVSAVLARTWAAMGSLQGRNDDQDEDELLELARDLVQLNITKSTTQTPSKNAPSTAKIASTPFKNLLFSVPVVLSMHIPSPLDLFLSPSDLQIYSSINAYLLSIRRAHLRLTDLWKITSLRRDHPAPPGPPYGSSRAGRYKVLELRKRGKQRAQVMRSVWATSSAAVFFLGETEAYLQGEVVRGTWTGFKDWLTSETNSQPGSSRRPVEEKDDDKDEEEDEEDIWLQAVKFPTTITPPLPPSPNHTRDPQSLADAHRKYLTSLTTSLLLTTPSFTDPLFHLLQQIDHLVALVHRIHTIWQSLDLEADEGVVDAFSDFQKEEVDIRSQLHVVGTRVKGAIEVLVHVLGEVDGDREGWDDGFTVGEMEGEGEEGRYRPGKVWRVHRLLMKLDFGGWFGGGRVRGADEEGNAGGDEDGFEDL
ncbi:gamma-tubulin complex component protein [Amylocarpus encephaloides]|uniref:Spindle pole body component n=1 Tax=Amylocarpus encephaloides TaxID=45428 RepID=A0A9P8C393_9HELO|nr:gamma-tubulin complex component protein [Amylocarpus encephaloides]